MARESKSGVQVAPSESDMVVALKLDAANRQIDKCFKTMHKRKHLKERPRFCAYLVAENGSEIYVSKSTLLRKSGISGLEDITEANAEQTAKLRGAGLKLAVEGAWLRPHKHKETRILEATPGHHSKLFLNVNFEKLSILDLRSPEEYRFTGKEDHFYIRYHCDMGLNEKNRNYSRLPEKTKMLLSSPTHQGLFSAQQLFMTLLNLAPKDEGKVVATSSAMSEKDCRAINSIVSNHFTPSAHGTDDRLTLHPECVPHKKEAKNARKLPKLFKPARHNLSIEGEAIVYWLTSDPKREPQRVPKETSWVTSDSPGQAWASPRLFQNEIIRYLEFLFNSYFHWIFYVDWVTRSTGQDPIEFCFRKHTLTTEERARFSTYEGNYHIHSRRGSFERIEYYAILMLSPYTGLKLNKLRNGDRELAIEAWKKANCYWKWMNWYGDTVEEILVGNAFEMTNWYWKYALDLEVTSDGAIIFGGIDPKSRKFVAHKPRKIQSKDKADTKKCSGIAMRIKNETIRRSVQKVLRYEPIFGREDAWKDWKETMACRISKGLSSLMVLPGGYTFSFRTPQIRHLKESGKEDPAWLSCDITYQSQPEQE